MWPQPIGGFWARRWRRTRERKIRPGERAIRLRDGLLPLAECAGVHPIHTDNAGPRDRHSDNTRVDVRSRDRGDRNAHDDRDDGQRGLSCAAAPLDGLLTVCQLGLMPQLCGMCSGKLLHSFGQARGHVFVVFRPELHPRCQCGLAISAQLLAGLVRDCAVLRLHRIRRCRIRRIGLRIPGKRGTWLRVVLRRVVLSGIVLRRVVLGRLILRWLVLWRMRLWGRPLSRWLGHVHRIVRRDLGSWTVGRRLGFSNVGF
jgi:hypothetical protein